METPVPIVDVWMQHPTPRFAEQPFFKSLLRWMGVDEFPEMPIEMTVGAMDAAGVSKAMLCAWHGPMGALISNDEVAAHVAAHPERFVGVAAVDLHRPMDALRELRRCVNDLGFKALRIVQWLWNLPPNDRRYYPLYAECINLGIPVCLQVGHTGPLCPSEPGRPIPYLDDVLLEFPELVVVGGHVGYPWTDEVISLATKYPNFYLDTSAYKVKRLPPEFVAFMKGRGKNKVMFGTNYPMIAPDACLNGIDDLGLDEETTRLFLHDNAARVFGL
jgi:predicted TIM-barrel fold metal-dependent hydrolase